MCVFERMDQWMVKVAAFLAALALVAAAWAEGGPVEPDPEVHRVVGGLYALSATASLKGGKALPTPQQLKAYFTDPSLAPQTAEAGGAWWVGVPVSRFSTARHFLRAHAPDMGIMDKPGGQPWLGGESAWMKVDPARLQAAPGADKKGLFLRGAAGETDYWWQAPALKASARDAVLKRWRAKSAPALHAPQGVEAEKFTASPVGLPPEMHVGPSSDDVDFSIPAGNVMINPIPLRRGD